MRINRIVVSTYRGALRCDLNLAMSRGLSVIAGINGSGKTSLIEACRFALGQVYGLRPQPAYPFAVDVNVIGNDGAEYVFHRDLMNHTIADRVGNVVLFGDSQMLARIGVASSWYFTSWRDPRFTDGVELQAGNQSTPPTIPGMTREVTLEWVKTTLVRWFVSAQFNNDPAQLRPVQSALERLSSARNLFTPERQGEFVVRSINQSLAATGFNPVGSDFKFDLFLRRSWDGKLLSVNDFSSGELELLCFLGVLVLNNQLSIVYIDEPELHLNPQWHKILLRAMQMVSPNVQFIVATHSPDVWNSAYPEQRFIMNEGVVRS